MCIRDRGTRRWQPILWRDPHILVDIFLTPIDVVSNDDLSISYSTHVYLLYLPTTQKYMSTKCKAQTVAGRVEKSLLCDPGSELRLGGRDNRRAKIINGMEEKQKKKKKNEQ